MKNLLARAALATGCLGVLAGCAGYSPGSMPAGTNEADIATRMGAPSGRYTIGGPPPHERLEYARGPYGHHTYMLDLDANGRLADWRQVLVEPEFNAIKVGDSRQAVLERIGHASEVSWLPWQRYTLWSYRYETPFCQWFQVSLDAGGRVAETGYGPDPSCAKDGNDMFQ